MRECYFISCSSKSLEVELMTKSSIFTCLDGVSLFVVFPFFPLFSSKFVPLPSLLAADNSR